MLRSIEIFAAATSSRKRFTITRLTLALSLLGLSLLAFLPAAPAHAAVGINKTINFQGRLLNAAGAVVADGTYNMEFQLWQNGTGCTSACTSANAAANNGGTLKWTEDWVYGINSPDNRVTVKNGYFSVPLGSICAVTATTCTASTGNAQTNSVVDFNQDTLYLSMNVGGVATAANFAGAAGDGYMIPFRRLASAVYALNAGSCSTCMLQAPTSTAQNTITPTVNSVTGLTVNGTSGTAAAAVNIVQAGDAANLTLANTGTTINNLLSVTQSTSAFTGTALLVNLANGSGSFASGNFIDLQANGVSKYKIDNLGVQTLVGAQAADITTLAGTAATALVFQPGNSTSSATGAAFTLQAGNNNGVSVNGGKLTLKGGDATGTSTIGGGVDVDSGSGTFGGGVINIAPTNSRTINIGNAATSSSTNINGSLNLNNTWTTAQNTRFSIQGAINSSSTGQQNGIQNSPSFSPSGLSVGDIYGLINIPNIAGSSLGINNVIGAYSRVDTGGGYTGQIINGVGFQAGSPATAGTNKFTNYMQYQADGISSNGGNTAGTLNNSGLKVLASTAAAGAGGVVNNYGVNITVPTGSGAGTTNNYGLYLQGAGGGTSNYSLYNGSSATSLFTGNVVGPSYDALPGGTLSVGTTNATAINLNQNTLVASGKTLTVGVPTTVVTGSQVVIAPATNATIGLVVEGLSGQTVNLIQFRDSTGSVLGGFRGGGGIYAAATAPFTNVTNSFGAGISTNAAAAFRAVSGQSVDTLQLQDFTGATNSSFNASGQLVVGRIGAAGLQGVINFADGTTANSPQLQAAPSQTASPIFQLPAAATGTYAVCTTAAVCAGYAATGGSGASTALSNLAAVAINTSLLPGVTNTIDAGSAAFGFRSLYGATSVLTPLLDTIAAASALNVGTTNANVINLNQNVVVGTDKSLTFGFSSGNTAALQLSVAASTLFTVDTTNNRVTLGAVGTCSGAPAPGPGRLCVNTATSTSSASIVNTNSTTLVTGTAAGSTISSQYIVAKDTSVSAGNTVNVLTLDSSATTNANSTVNSIIAKVPASQPGNFLQFQNGASPVVTVTNAGAITVSGNAQLNGSLGVLGAVQFAGTLNIGSNITDAVQVNLQLDSSNTFADSGTCSATVNQGAMYYNTNSNSIRSCVNSAWSDVVTTSGLGIMLFGVLPDSGANPGDLPGLTTPSVTGPCKVSASTSVTTSVTVGACTAYSGGRKIVYPGATVALTTGVANQTIHLCFDATGTLTQVGGANALVGLPTFSITAPLLCLADISISATANVPAAIYDVRTFTTSEKEFVTTSTTAPVLGSIVVPNGAHVNQPALTIGLASRGVVVAASGTPSTTAPSAIIAVSGPGWVKATAGTSGAIVQTGATLFGYAVTGAASATAYGNLGFSRSTFPAAACAAGVAASPVNCDRSLYTLINIK